jgi:hypothetical protein
LRRTTVGVDIPAGKHEVRFRYEPYSHYALLLAIGAFTLLGLVLVPRHHAFLGRFVRARTRDRAPVVDAADAAVVDRPSS